MNSNFSVASLSKQYEGFFAALEKHNTSKDTCAILNNMFICSIISLKLKLSKLSYSDAFSKINEQYPGVLFDVKANCPKRDNTINEIYESINSLVKISSLSDFEKMLGSVLEKHINRKKTGSYYTPEDTTKFICWNSIIISILNKLPKDILDKIYSSINITNNVEFIDKKLTFEEKIKILKTSLSKSDINHIVQLIKELRIIDPTCGSGAFIISAYECLKYLNQSLLMKQLDSKYFYKNVYGVDILEEAIMFTKTRMIIKTLVDGTFNSDLVKEISKKYICSDALCGPDKMIDGKNGLDWNNYEDFDCIVGNPPYVEVKDKKPYINYNSNKCGNLYAYAIERACNISHNGSIVSFIVPLPLIATPRMDVIKEYLEQKSSIVYYSTFADRPGCLFSGVHQRLAIFFANIGNEECRRFTSSYKFWYKDERKYLFKSLDFIENNHNSLPKIGTNIENSIFVKNKLCNSSIYSLASDEGTYPLYISSRIGFWAKAFINKPDTNEISVFKFKTKEERTVAYCFINSSLFYYMWILNSDCWHVTNSDLKNIKFNFDLLSEKQIKKLMVTAKELADDLEKNKVRINSKQTEFEYKHKYSKKIIDKIDDIICLNIGLDPTETKYIKNYTLKYRLNKIDESEESL